MSAFLAFRTAVVSVLGSTRVQPIARDVVPLLVRGLKSARTHPKNGQIPYQFVQLQDANGTLHHAEKLTKILDTVDHSTHILRLISHDPPVVQILAHLDDKMQKLERKATRKANEERKHVVNKEAQLTWFTADQDFDHKVVKVREDLEKGDVRIDVVFNPKAGVRNPTKDEMLEHLDEVARRVADVANEWREREFRRGSARVSFQSTVKKEKLLPTQEEMKEMAKEAVKKRERQLSRQKQKEERQKDIDTIL
ncbi:hypothetical protein GALMADRAFT_250477 [Galerina marginata CBS 339.88]|uniref:Ribosome recycling factor domain-containing protein n=1 Tax=Galerina marginata (strain CBS 339.88) TaxID=685588 RepID=A0A067T3L6_GALM3|nr:hypothetical protein GALMADRAFT_250477 [Galerina marginata CBS 339.88]